jgi:hypothetical protein
VVADLMYGGILGEQALRLVVLAFILQRFRARMRFFPLSQQALAVGGLLLNDRVISAACTCCRESRPPPATGGRRCWACCCGRWCSCCSMRCGWAARRLSHVRASPAKNPQAEAEQFRAARRSASSACWGSAACRLVLQAAGAGPRRLRHRSEANRIRRGRWCPGAA